MSVKEAQPMKTKMTQLPSAKNRRRILETIAAILVIVALIGSMALLFQSRQASQSSQESKGMVTSTAQASNETTATAIPEPPTSVMLRVSASGIPPTTRSEIIIPSGMRVTLTAIPDHSLLPFQTFTMGIYATDPYGFSELQNCTYPKTGSCSYTVAYSSSEGTDYTKGKHTFRAFLGNIGGAILKNSNSVTITWS
jgi:type II secretory pathway pseudopilin PulG